MATATYMQLTLVIWFYHNFILSHSLTNEQKPRDVYLRQRTTRATTKNVLAEVAKVYTLENTYKPSWGYVPYWKDGEWVFMEDVAPGGSTTDGRTVCGDSKCHFLYTHIGPVCAVNMRTKDVECRWYWSAGWKCDISYYFPLDLTSEHITFPSYCEFLRFQCDIEMDPVQTYYGQRWMMRHVGACEKETDIMLPLYNGDQIAERYKKTVNRLEELKKNITNTAPVG